jgi:hypothetical protein
MCNVAENILLRNSHSTVQDGVITIFEYLFSFLKSYFKSSWAIRWSAPYPTFRAPSYWISVKDNVYFLVLEMLQN